jgi:DNA-binding CsgD family transcriptional regulator
MAEILLTTEEAAERLNITPWAVRYKAEPVLTKVLIKNRL